MSSLKNRLALSLSAALLPALSAQTAAAANLLVPNQFGTIQAAVDAAVPGDVIVLKGGTFDENVLLEGKSELTIKAKKGARLSPTTAGFGLRIVNSRDVQVFSLEVEGTSDTAIRMEGCQDILIEGCKVRNSGFDAILAVSSERIVVRKNDLRDLVGSGIALIGVAGDISDNRIERSDRHGIFVSGPGYSIEGNEVVDTVLQGVEARAFGNDIHANLLISENRLNRTFGLQVGGFLGVNILANEIEDSTADGMRMLNAGLVLISGNTIKGSGDDGLDLSQSATVLGNTISKSASEGLHLRLEAGGSLVKSNKVRKSGAVGIQIDALGAMVLDNDSAKNLGFDFQAASEDILLVGNDFPNSAQ